MYKTKKIYKKKRPWKRRKRLITEIFVIYFTSNAKLLTHEGNSSESESEPDDDNCQTLTDIASGYTRNITGDFFGDNELAGLCVCLRVSCV